MLGEKYMVACNTCTYRRGAVMTGYGTEDAPNVSMFRCKIQTLTWAIWNGIKHCNAKANNDATNVKWFGKSAKVGSSDGVNLCGTELMSNGKQCRNDIK